MVKFDGGTWMARTLPGEEPQLPVSGDLRFDYIINCMRRGIGEHGIVAVLNARGANDPNGADFRYEWLFDQGWNKLNGSIGTLAKDERGFWVLKQNICVIKGQEVWTPEAGFIFYGGPYGKNVNSKTTEKALIEGHEDGCICGISKILDEKALLKILETPTRENIDFIVTYRGTRMGLGNPNQQEKEFYDSHWQELGIVAMSKGYQLETLLGKPTIGTSYTEIPAVSSKRNFIENLKHTIMYTTLNDVHGRPLYSGVFTHGINMVLDKCRGIKNTVMRD